jgi:hypothetical protein
MRRSGRLRRRGLRRRGLAVLGVLRLLLVLLNHRHGAAGRRIDDIIGRLLVAGAARASQREKAHE